MGLLSRVHHVVRVQDAMLREPLVANVAFKRSFARVRPHMGIEAGNLAELLSAEVALKFLLYWETRRPLSAALHPRSRIGGTDGAIAGRRVTVCLGYRDACSLTGVNTKYNYKTHY